MFASRWFTWLFFLFTAIPFAGTFACGTDDQYLLPKGWEGSSPLRIEAPPCSGVITTPPTPSFGCTFTSDWLRLNVKGFTSQCQKGLQAFIKDQFGVFNVLVQPDPPTGEACQCLFDFNVYIPSPMCTYHDVIRLYAGTSEPAHLFHEFHTSECTSE